MKTKLFYFTIICLILLNIFKANCQVVTKNAQGYYESAGRTITKEPAKDTGMKFKDKDGTLKTIWQGSKGAYYVEMISKTGKSYKKYIKIQ